MSAIVLDKSFSFVRDTKLSMPSNIFAFSAYS